MDTKKHFQKIVIGYRRELLAAGFKASTLTNWAKGRRFPSEKAAKRIAEITGKNWKFFPVLRRR